MVTYYIDYGEPEPRRILRKFLLVLLCLLLLAIVSGIAYSIYLLVTDEDGPAIVLPVSSREAAASDEAEAVPLGEAVTSLYVPRTNTVFLVDVSRSISDGGDLSVVKRALLDVVLPYVEGQAEAEGQAALMTFTSETNTLVDLGSLADSGTQSQWLAGVDALDTEDRPAYIHDAVKAAHGMLAELNDSSRVNVIVLLTDGSDGGFLVIDPTRTMPCPEETSAPPGMVCTPRPAADGDGKVYEPFNPADLETCPPQLGVAPGRACAPVFSATSQGELLAMLQSGQVPNLMVNTIGFGQEADQVLLKLLAQAGEHPGRHIYADN